jgi:hypothetical protein
MKRLFLLTIVLGLVISGLACDEANEILQKGTIKGNVSNSGTAVSGALVMLLEEGQLLAGGAPLANGNVTDSSGNYEILLVEPSTYYYVCAVEDNDSDLTYTPGVDKIGYYGSLDGFNWIPTSVSVSPGETKTGIDITSLL